MRRRRKGSKIGKESREGLGKKAEGLDIEIETGSEGRETGTARRFATASGDGGRRRR